MMDEQLKVLMEYTQFHIGMYATLCTLLIAVLKLGGAKIAGYYGWLVATLILFALAGMFGGLVGSSIPYFTEFSTFSKATLGPFETELVPALLCTHLEHLMFWLGITVSIVGLLYTKIRPNGETTSAATEPKRSSREPSQIEA